MVLSILHNPRCSKSRKTLEIIENHNIEAEIILYLQNPPSETELKALLGKLGIEASNLIRKGESIIKDLNIDLSSTSDDDLISMMVEHPVLIERPIVYNDTSAIIGRPPENVQELI
ncbi:MAG TPA: arsenate reductase (glutaredoxin) [Gammaproteobacteria bacterium]|jgi:arsenate reductase|nr:arsenate reductase (glutaredoxin) [Gammaproteobacteria bacterium]HJM08823.1 arsenate reductase (glutaredoxin) [Gammaproteobacteria bacterium]HJN00519.1 arsenate reductase (glutaredoxin) [Gammaproteobacteria bacterium]|tara:strand:- start:7196 stop:7543 length:348 start_codon:yes stop_codon:yes gene_type:complete